MVQLSNALHGHPAIEMVKGVSVGIELAETHPVEIDLMGIGVELIELE